MSNMIKKSWTDSNVPYNPEKLSLEKDPPLHVDEIYAADPHLVDEF